MQVACLLNLSPSKLGSLEAWMASLAVAGSARGHQIDFYCNAPVHPSLTEQLDQCGARLEMLDRALAGFWPGRRRLAAYDVIHLNLFAPRSRVAMLANAAWPARVLFVDHYSGAAPPSPSGLRRFVDALTFHRVAGLAGVSEFVTRRDVDRFRLSPERVRTIYNGVPLERFGTRAPDVGAPPTLMAVASLIPEKGLDSALKALARMRVSDARLWIVGEGPERDRLVELAGRLEIDGRTSFLGLRDDVPDLLQKCHVFVHPAMWQEAFGLVIAEAMASGRPVVASAVGGIPELVRDGLTGTLVEPGDPNRLADALDSLLMNGDLRRRMGTAGRKLAEEKFSLEQCVRAHLDWCEETVRHSLAAKVG